MEGSCIEKKIMMTMDHLIKMIMNMLNGDDGNDHITYDDDECKYWV